MAQALNALRESALAYVDLCAERTGWGNPFADLEEDREEEQPQEEADGATVDLEARYRIRVNDVEAAARLLGAPAAEDIVEGASDVVSRLFMRDGWNPAQYDDLLTLVDHEWTCGPARQET
ncbi:hypothetical protein ACTWPT_11065 [Nonomuraea sp. 3N208]|uniref:hypothetical protein n=1 Tax=Nonomuraea sp. 3N208 TaxID=3457421 RepID=UPI003FCCF016